MPSPTDGQQYQDRNIQYGTSSHHSEDSHHHHLKLSFKVFLEIWFTYSNTHSFHIHNGFLTFLFFLGMLEIELKASASTLWDPRTFIISDLRTPWISSAKSVVLFNSGFLSLPSQKCPLLLCPTPRKPLVYSVFRVVPSEHWSEITGWVCSLQSGQCFWGLSVSLCISALQTLMVKYYSTTWTDHIFTISCLFGVRAEYMYMFVCRYTCVCRLGS